MSHSNRWTRCSAWVTLAALMVAAWPGDSAAEQVRCPVTKDVWISGMPEEAQYSMGKTETLKLKVL